MDVLLVEDEALVRELLQDDLAEAGLAVMPACSAEAGLAAVEQDGPPPAVLVTDVNLGPGMSGLDLAREAERRWPATAVLVMTGDARNLDRMPERFRQACLLKPFEPVRLVSAVRRLLRRAVP